jgi:hypothetical protein
MCGVEEMLGPAMTLDGLKRTMIWEMCGAEEMLGLAMTSDGLKRTKITPMMYVSKKERL